MPHSMLSDSHVVEGGGAASSSGGDAICASAAETCPTKRPFLIGVCGGTACGKTTVCNQITATLDARVALVAADSFYKNLDRDKHVKALAGEYNFDHPAALDMDLIYQTLVDLRDGKTVQIPVYDFITHTRRPETVEIQGAEVIIFEGILALYDKNIRDLLDLKVFVDTDDDVRLVRRIKRDMRTRGLELDFILAQYLTSVKPCFEEYVWPTKKFADIVIPRGGDNYVAVNLLVQHIHALLSGDLPKADEQAFFMAYSAENC